MTKGKLALRSIYVSMAKETMETLISLVKYLFCNIVFPKFYLNQTGITIKKRENLIQEEASKFSKVSKFLDVLQLERVNLSDVLLIKRKGSVTI